MTIDTTSKIEISAETDTTGPQERPKSKGGESAMLVVGSLTDCARK